MAPLPSFTPGTPKTGAAINSMEDFTETEDREITPMEVTDTGEITEIGPLEEEEEEGEATERGRTGDIIEIDQRADMTGITIMRGTIEKEGEEMDFNNRSVSDIS